MCDRCGYELESPDHIFVSCLFARCIWWNIFRWIKVPMPPECISLGDLLESLQNTPGSQKWKRIVHTVALASIWRIWIARNKKVFDGNFITVQKTVEDIKEDAFVWISHRANTVPSWDDWINSDVSIMLQLFLFCFRLPLYFSQFLAGSISIYRWFAVQKKKNLTNTF
ncbi:hypothetical protein HanRHA438_Chr17g0799581 [Helianthus annuus]|nr:hypothetical protein HanRHA438_Chr17g0799581 [Helianthus annuus]